MFGAICSLLVLLNYCKEYLTMIKFNTTVLLQILYSLRKVDGLFGVIIYKSYTFYNV